MNFAIRCNQPSRPNQRGRLNFDAPNRVLFWGEIAAPWKLTVSPIFEIHSGFPYSTINEYREFVGPRNESQFPHFVSTDIQVWRRVRLPIKESHARVGFGVYNLFNRGNFANPVVRLNNVLGTGAGQLQPGQAYTPATAGSFGTVLQTVESAVGLGAHRQIQLSLRFNF